MFQYICRGEILTPVRAHLPRWQETTTIRDGVSEGQFFQVLLYQMDADYLNETRKSNFHLEEILASQQAGKPYMKDIPTKLFICSLLYNHYYHLMLQNNHMNQLSLTTAMTCFWYIMLPLN